MINRIVTIRDTTELLVDRINDLISNKLYRGECVMDIKYIEDGKKIKPPKNGNLDYEIILIAIIHIGEREWK